MKRFPNLAMQLLDVNRFPFIPPIKKNPKTQENGVVIEEFTRSSDSSPGQFLSLTFNFPGKNSATVTRHPSNIAFSHTTGLQDGG
ncbi:MAG: hypothetical protein JO371_05680 [Paraburkholderia sp.]|nr:hypothetical protein [Paraburkholderia sp.]